MSAMAKFIGVDCLPCKRAGHKCQAQTIGQVAAVRRGKQGWSDVPMCLRCANDEPCFAVTAPLNFETPKRMLGDSCEMVMRTGNRGERYGILAATA